MSIPKPPVEVTKVEQTENTLRLTYLNENENIVVERIFKKIEGGKIFEKDREIAYSYVDNEWSETHCFTREYTLYNDGKTLKGDTSNWTGRGENWRRYFLYRHYKRLSLRFPNDKIEHSPIDMGTYSQYNRIGDQTRPTKVK